MRGAPGCSGYAPDSGLPRVAVPAGGCGVSGGGGGLRRTPSCARAHGEGQGDAVLPDAQCRGLPRLRPQGARGLEPLPAPVGSPGTSSRWLEVWCEPTPGQVPWGRRGGGGGSAAQGAAPRKGGCRAGRARRQSSVGSRGAAGVKPGGLHGRGGSTGRSRGWPRPGRSAATAADA